MTREEAQLALANLKRYMSGGGVVDKSVNKAIDMAIEALSQPEIIRCKDCKHQIKEWRDDKRLKDKGYWVYGCKVISDICGYWAWFGQDDDFCSEAERRTNE